MTAISENQKIFKENVDLAISFQNNGKFQEAEAVYKNLLKEYPANFDVLNLLGVLYFQAKKYDESILYITEAIKIKPSVISYNNLAQIYAIINDIDKAIWAYQKAIELNPDNAETYNKLGLIFRGENRVNEAIICYKKALAINPDFLNAVFNLANALRLNKNLDEAINYYYKALELKPDFEGVYNNLGAVFNEKNEKEKAVICYKKAIEINPDFLDAYCNLASVLSDLGKVDEGLSFCHKAIEINPDYKEAYIKIGVILYYEKRFEEAENWYRKAIKLFPDNEEMLFNLGTILILHENLEEGWKNYDNRHFKSVNQKLKLKSFKQPLWSGESIQNKAIYTYYEQGFGDSIQFARYLTILSKMGAKVLFKVQNPLVSLFKQNFPDIEILDDSIKEETIDFNAFIPLLSLPGALKTTINSIPAKEKYLKADSEKVNYYKNNFFDNGNFKVGIVWQGSATNKNDKNRSISLDFFSEFAKLENVSVYSLQKGAGEEQLINSPLNIVNLGSSFNDFSDTAAAIENLDLVITVDTAIAHLAGALGKPTWILIPFMPCWRWFLDREDSPWYESVRLFRQQEPGNWNEVRNRLLENFKEIIKAEKIKDNNVKPLLIQTMIGEDKVCSRVRITEPNRFCSTVSGVKTVEAVKTADLNQGALYEKKVFIWQRIWPETPNQQKQLLSRNYLVINEIDDDPLRWEDYFKKNNFFAFRSSHGIQTSTEPLAEFLREYNPNVKVFMNHLAYLPPVRNYTEGKITIFFGALNREDDWKPIISSLNNIISSYKDKINVKVIYDKLFFDSLNTKNKEFSPFCSYNIYEKILREADIAILPLEFNRFNSMKSDLKFIESAGHCVAVLASPTVYSNTVDEGKTGLIYNSIQDFEEKLVMLIENESFRHEITKNAYNYVAKNRLLSMHYQERLDWYYEMIEKLPHLNEELKTRAPELD